MSWWPWGKKENLHSTGHFTPPFRKDVEWEMGNPSAIVSLDCLDEEDIASWWQRVKVSGVAIPFAQVPAVLRSLRFPGQQLFQHGARRAESRRR
jgi:hypothetical protein